MATQSPRSNGSDVSPVQPFRRSSISSDTMSTSARSNTTAPTVPHVNPPPAYVARSEASDLISTELGRAVDISPPALTLLNEFLDHVLYNIICVSQSVGLGQLKAAIPVVLKPRLGKAALRVAEEELKDYIEDEEAEELYSRRTNVNDKLAFDVDLVWKLARLRCMVYARMGDLEEEDEEEWLDKEQFLDQAAALSSAARKYITVTPGAAIFLTSVVEYLGEQALYYAAQYAQKRHDTARHAQSATADSRPQLSLGQSEIVLDGKDMNHIGRDSPLSRLWRSWRRNTRSPVETFSSPISPLEEIPNTSESAGIHAENDLNHPPGQSPAERRQSSNSALLTPSRIPLPISENDVNEIEGRDYFPVGDPATRGSRRPSSMPVIPANYPRSVQTPTQEVPGFQERSPLRPTFDRTRSNSLPTGGPLPTFNSGSPIWQRRSTIETPNEPLDYSNEAAPAVQPMTYPLPGQLINTVGTNADILGAVGVHHVRQPDSLETSLPDIPETQPLIQSTVPNQPLMSASIKGPDDFDMMYVPDGDGFPEASPDLPTVRDDPKPAMAGTDRYREIAVQQLKEHERYSQQAHEMSTPSIYTNPEHSPRFPRDEAFVKASSEGANGNPRGAMTPEFQKATIHQSTTTKPVYNSTPERGNVVSSYTPTPEHQQFYDENKQYIHREADPELPRNHQLDSPVSQISSKNYTKRVHSEDEPVPDLPRTVRDQPAFAADLKSRSRGHSKSSSSSSRLLGFTRDTDGKPHSIYQQRAIGGMTDDVRRAHSSTPDSRNGPPETEYPVSAAKRQHLRIRADTDTNVLGPSANEYTAERSLEMLINSDETLHYTLTPATANFRDEDIQPYPRRTETQDLADFFRNTAPPGQETTAMPSARSRKTSMNAARAPQVLPVSRGTTAPSIDVMSQTSVRQKRNPVGEPRDAKVDRMSGVRDLAEWARSTGPNNEDQLPKPLASHLVMPSVTQPVEMAAPTSPKTPTRKQPNRLKFQARDPRPSRHAESTALIEFIREGPPTSNRPGVQATSLRTADSDNLSNLTSSQPKRSSDTNGLHSVAESQSPLLSNDARSGTAAVSSLGQQASQNRISNGQPKTRRRPKDPYSLDDSDDEYGLDQPTRQTNEESLIDFLRNTAPTTAMTAQPIMMPTQQPVDSSSLNRAVSVDRLKDVTRGNQKSSVSTSPVLTQSQARARAESPHLTQAGSKLDSYRPTQTTHASHVDRNRAKSKPRNGAPRNETVQLKKGYGETADLADYLRNTGPTPTQEGWTQPLVERQANGVNGPGTGGLKKFFSMRGRK